MKKMIFVLAFVLAGKLLTAQPKPADLDKSPMDVSYDPTNYPILKMQGKANAEPFARLIYSRPQKKGREIFGGEVKYNEVWRLGANEATELELFKNAVIGGKKIAKGRYTLYCIPTETKWTIIISNDNYKWGSFTYKNDKDVARIDVPVTKNSDITEALTMYFDNNKLVMMWDYAKAEVPISF